MRRRRRGNPHTNAGTVDTTGSPTSPTAAADNGAVATTAPSGEKDPVVLAATMSILDQPNVVAVATAAAQMGTSGDERWIPDVAEVEGRSRRGRQGAAD